MRDEIGSRFWVEHHAAFGRELEAGIAALRGWLGSHRSDGTAQLLAMVAAVAITLLTFNTAALA